MWILNSRLDWFYLNSNLIWISNSSLKLNHLTFYSYPFGMPTWRSPFSCVCDIRFFSLRKRVKNLSMRFWVDVPSLACEIEESRLLLGEWPRFWSRILGEWKKQRDKKGSPPFFHHYFLLLFHLRLRKSPWDPKKGENQSSTKSLCELVLPGDWPDQGFVWTFRKGRTPCATAVQPEEPYFHGCQLRWSSIRAQVLGFELNDIVDMIYCHIDLIHACWF